MHRAAGGGGAHIPQVLGREGKTSNRPRHTYYYYFFFIECIPRPSALGAPKTAVYRPFEAPQHPMVGGPGSKYLSQQWGDARKHPCLFALLKQPSLGAQLHPLRITDMLGSEGCFSSFPGPNQFSLILLKLISWLVASRANERGQVESQRPG